MRRRSPRAFERLQIREENVMRNRNTFLTGAAALLLALTTISAVAQQPGPDANQRLEAERRAAELERQQEERRAAQLERQQAEVERHSRQLEERQSAQERQLRERDAVQEDLEEARKQLQEAARRVAELSGEFAAPYIDGIARGFRFAGQRSMLGVGIEDTERGVRIASVSPNGPAAQAGIKVGDTITAIDGADLTDTRVAGGGKQSPSEILVAQMGNVDGGETVKLRVLNESGAERDVSVTTREISPFVFLQPQAPLPALPSLAPKGPGHNYSYSYGGPGTWFSRSNPWSEMQLVTLTPALGKYFGTDKGLLVVRGPEDDAFGLRDGDVLLDISGREPTSPEHAMRILGSFAAGEPMKVTVMREQRRQTLDLKIPVPADR
jgi:hypothetical protein